MHEKLADALHYIRDSFIAEAAAPKRKIRRPVWISAIAAILVIVILINFGGLPFVIQARAVAIAPDPRIMDYPKSSNDPAAAETWRAQLDARETAVIHFLENCSFLYDSTGIFLSGSNSENQVWSPVNGFIALAMLAETASGESRQQILSALNADSLDTLRAQVSAVWEAAYDDGNNPCTLANSLWLDETLECDQEIMDALAYYCYASIYQGRLGSSKTNRAMQTWLNKNTAGLLSDPVNQLALPEDTVLALASTIYFQAKWAEQFKKSDNTQAVFHAPGGDITCTYMNQEEMNAYYYWGDSFGAVSLNLKGSSKMWLILPDEDKTVEDVLSEGQYMEMVTGTYTQEDYSKYMLVNLSLPKFDVASSADLKTGLQSMGITDIFDIGRADFTQAVQSETTVPVHITSVNQAARVTIDEEGVKAAAYIEIPGAGAAAPPEEIIDFILDRPFLFVIADYSFDGTHGLPLFAGVVNTP